MRRHKKLHCQVATLSHGPRHRGHSDRQDRHEPSLIRLEYRGDEHGTNNYKCE